jgi:hypothetical protein
MSATVVVTMKEEAHPWGSGHIIVLIMHHFWSSK